MNVLFVNENKNKSMIKQMLSCDVLETQTERGQTDQIAFDQINKSKTTDKWTPININTGKPYV